MRKVIFIFALFASGCPVQKGGDHPSPNVPVVVTEPSAEMKDIVQKIIPVQEPELGKFFLEFADVIQRDDANLLKTTYQFREVNRKAGELAFQRTGLKGKYPSLGQDLNDATIKALGDANTDLNKPRAIEFCKAAAWALN